MWVMATRGGAERRLEEVEGTLLQLGGVGEHLEGGNVVLVGETHLVAGEGGEMVEEGFETVGDFA